MEYKKIDNTYVVRILKGEDIIASIKELIAKENILAGTLTGLGAGELIEIGIYDQLEKVYKTKVYKGIYEITSLTGNISRKDGEPYLHMHINFSDSDNVVYGGHLLKAVIAITSEIFITVLNGTITRKFDENIGGFMLDLQ
jgi:predicted DNA-binding protein with PD1-like motif